MPFFFIASSYFLFYKVDREGADPFGSLINYLKRILIMYGFWFCVTFYITLREDFLPFLEEGGTVWQLVLNALKGSTFRGSWYLTASIICAIMIFFLSKICKIPNTGLLILGFLIFLPCIFYSSYREVIRDTWFYEIYGTVKAVVGIPWNRWPAGFIFMAIGKCFADQRLKGNKPKEMTVMISAAAIPVLFVLMMLEMMNVYERELYGANASNFTMILLSACLFLVAISVKLPDSKIYGWLRAASTVTFFSHFCFIWFYNAILKHHGFRVSFMMLYIGVLICSWLLTALILNLKKLPFLKWLKYAY